jgi:hypothetical protein
VRTERWPGARTERQVEEQTGAFSKEHLYVLSEGPCSLSKAGYSHPAG